MATMGAMREETKAAGDARVAAMSQAEAALALEKQRADNAVSEVSAMRQNMEDLQRRVEDQMASAAAGEEEERRRGEHVRSQLRRVEDDMTRELDELRKQLVEERRRAEAAEAMTADAMADRTIAQERLNQLESSAAGDRRQLEAALESNADLRKQLEAAARRRSPTPEQRAASPVRIVAAPAPAPAPLVSAPYVSTTNLSPVASVPANVGVGMEIETSGDTTTIKMLVPNGSALQSGLLQIGDKLVGVDGYSVVGWSAPDIRRRIVGPRGSRVTFRLIRRGEPVEVEITRGSGLASNPVRWSSVQQLTATQVSIFETPAQYRSAHSK